MSVQLSNSSQTTSFQYCFQLISKGISTARNALSEIGQKISKFFGHHSIDKKLRLVVLQQGLVSRTLQPQIVYGRNLSEDFMQFLEKCFWKGSCAPSKCLHPKTSILTN